MRRWPRCVIGAIAGAAVLLASAAASAQTCSLELKRLEPAGGVRIAGSQRSVEDLCRYGSSQGFHWQIRQSGQQTYLQPDPRAAAFAEIVKKEPKYESEYPFRGVANLGSQKFAFVLDEKPAEADAQTEESEAKAQTSDSEADKPEKKKPEAVRYERLLFDLNHNGDLTDDKMVEAEQPRGAIYAPGYAVYSFPRVDLTIDVDGTQVEYAFTMSGNSYASESYSYVSVSLKAAAYRKGEITLDGKTRQVFLLDFNSNGRFDDEFTVNDRIRYSDGRVAAQYGDMLLVDPDPEYQGYRSSYDVTTSPDQHQVSKLVNLDGRYYDVEISPAGDKLTLTASSVPLGHVTNPNEGLRAVLYSDQGLVKLSGGGSEPMAVPEGEWRLLGYTIDRTGQEDSASPADKEDEAKKTAEEKSLLDTLAGALVGSSAAPGRAAQPKYTLVSASATRDFKAIKVRKGETVALPCGPPYKPVVTVDYMRDEEAQLGLSIVGSAGERCTNLRVDGDRPDAPEFTIATPDGKEVVQGKFKYG